MDIVLGNEHTTKPAMLLDLNEDGPLNFNQLSPTPSSTLEATPTPSGEDSVDADKSSSYNSGRKLKNRKKQQLEDDENKETLAELLREKIEEDKKTRDQVKEQTNELLSVMKSLVNQMETIPR